MRTQASHLKPCLCWVCATQTLVQDIKGRLACSKPHVWALRTALKTKKRTANKSKMAKGLFSMVCMSHSLKTSHRNLQNPWWGFGAMVPSAFLLNTNTRVLHTHSTKYKSKMSSDPPPHPSGSVIWIQAHNFTSRFSTVYSVWHTKLWPPISEMRTSLNHSEVVPKTLANLLLSTHTQKFTKVNMVK